MGNFRVNGATGQAPTTSWMGYIPDRGFTMLHAQHFDSGLNANVVDSFGPANYLNLWTPYNLFVATGSGANTPTVSIGATVTAPDGTSSGTASHITEAATTGVHSLIAQTAIMTSIVQQGGWTMRLAVIAKAVERTRIALQISSPGSNCSGTTVFDLAGVQIGVATAITNGGGYSLPIAGPTSIKALGGGWCLCTMDIYFQIGQNMYQGLMGTCFLDAGSGTAPIDISYVGNGTSGIDVWRAIMLPPAAFAMSGAKQFHDDFDSIDTIDVNNTLAPGYKWYVNNIWPPFGWRHTITGAVPTPSNQISVANSILSLYQRPLSDTNENQEQLNTCAALPGGVASETATDYVGKDNTYVPPALIEVKASLQALPSNGPFPYLHWSVSVPLLGVPYPEFPPAVEFDFFDQGGVDASVVGGALYTWTTGGNLFEYALYQTAGGAVGYGIWNSTWNYSANNEDTAYYNGNFYVALNYLPTNSINQQPDISPTYWALLSAPPATEINSYTIYDPTLFNLMDCLLLPDFINSMGYVDAGWKLSWWNLAPVASMPQAGIVNAHVTYSPDLSHAAGFYDSTGYIRSWTTDPYMLILYAGQSDTQGPAQIDYVTVFK